MFPIQGTFRVISTIPSTVGGEGGRVKSPRGKTVMRSAPRGKPAQRAQRPPGSQDKAGERTQAARRAVWEAADVDTLPRFQCKRCGAGGFPTVGITGIHTFAKFCYIAASGRPDSKRLQIPILQFNCYHWNIHSITSTKYRQLGCRWYCEDPPTHLSHLG